MSEMGRYLYGIIETNERIELGRCGMPGGDALVYAIPHQGLGACVSDYPADGVVKADLAHCRAHEETLERLTENFTVLPFEFGIVAPSEEAVLKLLKRRRQGIRQALRKLQGKAEVEVKAFWKSLEIAAQEAVKEHASIARYRDEVASKRLQGSLEERIRIGGMIATALNEKRRSEASSLMKALRIFVREGIQRLTSADTMVLNASFLIRKAELGQFESFLQALGKQHEGRLDFKYTGPLPPYSFTRMALRV